MARETSIQVYNEIKQKGLLSPKRMEIYECIYLHGRMTASEVFQKLGLKTNQSGRFTELREIGCLSEYGTKICSVTSNTAIVWEVTNNLPTELPKQLNAKQKKKEVLDLITELAKELTEPQLTKLRTIYTKVTKI